MKKIFLIIYLMLVVFGSNAQSNVPQYKIEVNDFFYQTTKRTKNSSSNSKVRLILKYTDGSQVVIIEQGNKGDPITVSVDYWALTTTKQPLYFDTYIFQNLSGAPTIRLDQNYTYLNNCSSQSYYHKTDSEHDTPLTYNYSVSPIIEIFKTNGAETALPTHSKVQLTSNKGFASDIYNWEYIVRPNSTDIQNSTEGWIALPQYYGKNTIEFSAMDLIGNTAQNFTGTVVGMRQVACGGRVKSNIVRYDLRLSSPYISVESHKAVTCAYGNDGEVDLKLDRELYDGELLSVILKNLVTGSSIPTSNITKDDIVNNRLKIENIAAGEYRVEVIGFFNGLNTYSNTLQEYVKVKIEQNAPVTFETNREMVWCFGGNDGWIDISAGGGQTNGIYQYQLNDGDWTNFINQNTTRLQGLSKGIYHIRVRDAHGCVAKEIVDTGNNQEPSLGNEIVKTEVISEPLSPLFLEYTLNQQPTFYGGTNGKVVAKIEGGTPLSTGGYHYQWRDEHGLVLNGKTQTQFVNGSFYITLNGVGAGKYFLTITDKNYEIARAKEGCTIVADEITVRQPDPLVAEIHIHNPISCNTANVYGNEEDIDPQDGQRDESQDGALKVTVEGGVPFTGFENEGKPYKYFWKKQQANGNWENYQNNNEVLTNLSDGNYAINVEDRNGITMGIYINNVMTQATDSLFYFKEPEKLTMTFDKVDLKCSGDIGGKVTAKVKGGTGPYTYQWSNGATTATIENLAAMPYYVIIYDSKGCRVEGKIEIEAPVQMAVQESITPLICFNDTAGVIEIEVSGGVPPYTYVWDHGATTDRIDNLGAGTYRVEVRDAFGCGLSQAYTLENPTVLPFSLGEDVTLCQAQTWPLDIAINDSGATYKWTSDTGFESTYSKVVLRDAGIYTAQITTSKGCVVEDQIEIKRLDIAIDSEFLISTQAYVGQEVMLVNVSKPKGDQTEWLLPEDLRFTEIEDDFIKLRFDEEGEYEIGLRQYQGDCFATFYKKIIVEEHSGFPIEKPITEALVKEFTAAPVPNNGEFTVHIELAKESPISLRLINHISPQVLYRGDFSNSKKYEVPVKVSLPSGMYILILETGNQTISKKIIIL